MSDIIIFLHFVEYPLKQGGVSQDCSIVIDGHVAYPSAVVKGSEVSPDLDLQAA